jgi:hypothetical protein
VADELRRLTGLPEFGCRQSSSLRTFTYQIWSSGRTAHEVCDLLFRLRLRHVDDSMVRLDIFGTADTICGIPDPSLSRG